MPTKNEHLARIRGLLGNRVGASVPADALYGATHVGADELAVEVVDMLDTLPDGVTKVPGGRAVTTMGVVGLAAQLELENEPALPTLARLRQRFGAELPLLDAILVTAAADTVEPLAAAHVDAVRARVADWTATDEAIADQLNVPDPALPNPRARRIPRPLQMSTLMGKLAQPSRVKVGNHARSEKMIEAVKAGDRTGTRNWIQFFLDNGDISAAEAAAAVAEIDATDPDPRTPEHLSWAQAQLARHLTPAQVAQARPGA